MKTSTMKSLHIAALSGLLTVVSTAAFAQSPPADEGAAQTDHQVGQTQQAPASDMETTADSKILGDIHDINLAEIKMAKCAKKHATNKDVRSYARLLVREHKASETALMPVAKDANVTLTEGPTSKSDDALVKLKALTGSDFDRTFLTDMSDCHQKALDTIAKDLEGVQNKKVLAFVANVKVAVEKHKDAADALLAKTGETSSAD